MTVRVGTARGSFGTNSNQFFGPLICSLIETNTLSNSASSRVQKRAIAYRGKTGLSQVLSEVRNSPDAAWFSCFVNLLKSEEACK